MDVSEFKAKAKLIITKEVQSQIMFLHNKVGNIEWSGLLFYSIVSGDIEDPATLVLKTERIFLMDIGVATYTEFTPDESIVDFYDKYPESMGHKWGMIHTHHNMACFFSGTDTDELTSNAGSHNFYLSLIVNHASQFCAKIGIVAEIEEEVKKKYTFSRGISFKGLFDSQPEPKKVKHLLAINCEIIYEQDEFEVDRYEAIVLAKTTARTNHYSSTKHLPVGGFGKQSTMFREHEIDDDDYKYPYAENYHWDDKKKDPNKVYLTKTKNEIKKYLANLFSLDSKNVKDLREVIEEVHQQSKADPSFDSIYWDALHFNLKNVYVEVFGSQLTVEMYNKFYGQCLTVLEDYKNIGCAETTDEMVRTLDEYIDVEDSVELEAHEPYKGKKTHKFSSELDKQFKKAEQDLKKQIHSK